MYQFMKRWHKGKPGRQPVPHGFRTSFRSWAADCTDYPREIAEKVLSHVVPGSEGATRRVTREAPQADGRLVRVRYGVGRQAAIAPATPGLALVLAIIAAIL
jgi:hypothetical protein